MKNKFKLLWKNKIRLGLFIVLTFATILTAFVIPSNEWKNADIIERGTLVIRGDSMEPTIKNGQLAYVAEAQHERGSIVAVRTHSTLKYNSADNPVLLKRIVGLPGETVEITAEGILINGELLVEEYSENVNKTLLDTNDFEEVVLSDGEYFLVGDNRETSFDSRNLGAFNESKFLYGITLEPNDYTKSIERKNLITSIVILIITIMSPIVHFFVCTFTIPQKQQTKQRASTQNNKNKKQSKKKR